MAQQSIKKNYVYNVAIQLFSLLAPFLTTPYVSRVLQVETIGYYSYANSIATYFSLFAALGIGAYGAREVSMERGNRQRCTELFWELTGIRAVTTAVSGVLYLVAVFINGVNIGIYIACGVTLLSVAVDFTWFLQAMEDFRALMLRNFAMKSLSVVLIFTLVRHREDLMLYILIQTGSTLLANLMTLPQLHRYLGSPRGFHLCFRPHFRQILIYFIPTVASSVYTVLDRTMIGVITRSNVENGCYEQAHKVINILLTVITSLNVIVGMRTTYLFGQGQDDSIRAYIKKTFRFMSLVSMPMMFGLVGCARVFVPLFFGEGYDKVAPVLMLSSPIVFMIGISNIIGTIYLTPSGQRARSNRVIVAGAAVNFFLNLLLIPRFSSYGAVVASLAAEGVIALLYIRLIRAYISLWDIFRAAIKYALLSGIMLAIVCLIGVGRRGMPVLIAQVSAGAAVYIAGLLLTRDEIVFEELYKLKQKFFRTEKAVSKRTAPSSSLTAGGEDTAASVAESVSAAAGTGNVSATGGEPALSAAAVARAGLADSTAGEADAETESRASADTGSAVTDGGENAATENISTSKIGDIVRPTGARASGVLVRSGVVVSDRLRRVWEIELLMLEKFLQVCQKYSLHYFAAAGTLLGAVRHGGFIPWDDDIDLFMMREDYDRLLSVSAQEFSDPFFFQTAYTDSGYFRGHAQLRYNGTTAIRVGEGSRVRFHQGIFIDIFPLDAVPDSEEAAARQRRQLHFWNALLNAGIRNDPRQESGAARLRRFAVHAFSRILPPSLQYRRMEKICRAYNGYATRRVAQLSFDPDNKKLCWEREVFNTTVPMKFEGLTLVAPGGWDTCLSRQYGDYMTPRREPSHHGEVIFDPDTDYRETLRRMKQK